MATRKPSPRNRAIRPATEDLESRQLLSGTVSGTDIDGDTWTLRLTGPGSLNVTKQVGADDNPSPLNSATQIDEILIGGTDPLATRLVGTVDRGANGDGKVFFENLTTLPSQSLRFPGALGMLAINMPHFWLGRTTPQGAATPIGDSTPSITIPEGVATLRFGGVDTTVGQANPAPAGTTADLYAVTLGLPQYGGTRVIIDQSISSTQQVPSTDGEPTTIQHGVVFAVAGRLELFQANAIIGDAANPPGQFGDQVASASGTGGTIVSSGTAGGSPYLSTFPQLNGAGITGQIGDLRIGGDATNLTAIVTDAAQTNARITNFSIGGETDHVMVVAPNGLKNAVFGKGMDNTIILTHVINTLEANRGAINSSVTVDRTISQVHFGGDVVNTSVLTGYSQNFFAILRSVTGLDPNTGSPSGLPSPPDAPLNAQLAGGMSVRVAGDVENSVFTASVEPFNGVFGDPNQVVLPTGQIAAKVEGTIDNSIATPSQPNTAFYANEVHLNNGPVIPPNVPEPPYPGPKRPVHAPGLRNPLQVPQLNGLATLPPKNRLFTGGVATPRGPRGTRRP